MGSWLTQPFAWQDEVAEAQHAAQQLLPENHAVLLEARGLRQRQAQLQSSVDSLRAAKLSAQQECSMYGKPHLLRLAFCIPAPAMQRAWGQAIVDHSGTERLLHVKHNMA